jgi:glycosyltransferase involved in cell wall biosynthesis
MRYVWDLYHEYHRSAGRWIRPLFPWVAHYLRQWDRLSADRVDRFVANSEFVASRIRKFYRRDAQVVHPPVDVAAFAPNQVRSNHYLVLGQLVPYKRVDLAVRAFNELGLPLMVIGEGPQLGPLRALARSNVQVLGRQPFAVIRHHLETCRALVFTGVEDFGIVPVEAMAAGAPVIAFGRGGVLETVQDGITGCLFHEQTVDALKAAVVRVDCGAWRADPIALHAHAQRFDAAHFMREMRALVDDALRTHNLAQPSSTVVAPEPGSVSRIGGEATTAPRAAPADVHS